MSIGVIILRSNCRSAGQQHPAGAGPAGTRARSALV